jgi:hypothetical protein
VRTLPGLGRSYGGARADADVPGRQVPTANLSHLGRARTAMVAAGISTRRRFGVVTAGGHRDYDKRWHMPLVMGEGMVQAKLPTAPEPSCRGGQTATDHESRMA